MAESELVGMCFFKAHAIVPPRLGDRDWRGTILRFQWGALDSVGAWLRNLRDQNQKNESPTSGGIERETNDKRACGCGLLVRFSCHGYLVAIAPSLPSIGNVFFFAGLS